MRLFFWIIALLAAGGAGYVRLAPHDTEKVHAPIEGAQDQDMSTGAVRVIPADTGMFEAAVAYMENLPRTERLAGDVASGRVTFVTRSRVFGFPDYTTLELSNGRLKAYARLRFGQSDMGVNRERLEGLFTKLQAG